MPIVAVRRAWDRQPQQAPTIAQEWLARGLRFAFTVAGGLPFEAVRGVAATPVSGPTIGAYTGARGGALQARIGASGAANYYTIPHHESYNILGGITLFWFGTIAASGAFLSIASKTPTGGNGGSQTPFDLLMTNDANPYLVCTRANAAYQGWRSSDGMPVGRPTSGVFRASSDMGATPVIWVDGKTSTATWSWGSASGAPTSSTDPIWIGRRQDGAAQLNGMTELVLGFDGQLPDSAVLAILANPNIVFA